MTAPFLSLAQIRNRLTLQARHALRNPHPAPATRDPRPASATRDDPRPASDDRCPLCGAVAGQARSCYFLVVVASGRSEATTTMFERDLVARFPACVGVTAADDVRDDGAGSGRSTLAPGSRRRPG